MEKICNKCGEKKFFSEFCFNGTTADGFNPICRKCASEKIKAYYEKNQDRLRAKRNAYYQQIEKPIAKLKAPAEKICAKCKTLKPAKDFFTANRNPDKLYNYCKVCSKPISQARWKAKKADPEFKAHSARIRLKSNLKNWYGMTLAQYDEMLKQQEGRCWICRRLPEECGRKSHVLNIDHDHKTGEVRGLLCHHCNAGLGCFNENTSRFDAAKAYLEHFKEKQQPDP